MKITGSKGRNQKRKPVTKEHDRDETNANRSLKTALAESEEKYKVFFENSMDAILLTCPDGTIYSANPAACKLFEWSEEEICKKGRNGVVDTSDPRLEKALNERDSTGSFYGELILVKKSGEKFPAEISTAIFPSAERGQLTTMIIRDITERKATEEKLKASEAEYRSLFENSIMGISQIYPDGRYMRINKAYAEMYGYPDTTTMMKEVSSSSKFFSSPDDRKRVMEILDKSGYMPPTEFELNRRNGEKFWAVVSAKKVMDNDGKLLYLQADHRDITRRKKLEKEMYSASLYARSLIEASLDPLVTINSEGKITDVNLSTEKITGITRKNLIGSDFADYFENPDKARTGYKTVFSEGMVKDYPLTILHKSGRKIDVLYNATLFKNEKGEVQGVFAAARDITELKKIEEELRKSKELLEKLNQHLVEVRENERNQIALNLHDDLGQKLTAINLDIAWLKRRIGVQSQPVREKFEDMNRMIKDTIESIKETSAFLRPAILFDLGLVPAINSQLSKFEKHTGIKCHFFCEPEEFILDDRQSLILYRILQESLTNVARHSAAKTVEVNLRNLNKKVEMLITDDGIGIETSKVNSLKSMGIAGIKERVKSVLGKMTIIGEKGKGTKIKISIPLQKEKKDD
jgi:PAS domain S-box-containing protein